MIAILTSVFNCKKHSIRHKHYETFKAENSKLPIYTIELAYENYPFILQPNEFTLQIRSNAWIWQRERLISKLLEIVPKDYDNIALVDSDILFQDPNWHLDAESMLKECHVGQLFNKCLHNGNIAPDYGISNRDKGTVHTGYAWGYRREFLENGGLFDRCVVGGNDVLMTAAYCGWNNHKYFRHFNNCFLEYYFEWANKAFNITKGVVGYVDSDINHLWHGSRQSRNYVNRLSLLKGFNPVTDITIDENGCYIWNTSNTDMIEGVKKYIESRTNG